VKDLTKDELDELKRLHPGVAGVEEAGCRYFFLPRLELPKGCSPAETEALLCPTPRDGYEARLFFAVPITCGKTLNWNAKGVRIAERMWNAFSMKTPNGLRPAQMIATFLRALS
jgi:hypothetical protein